MMHLLCSAVICFESFGIRYFINGRAYHIPSTAPPLRQSNPIQRTMRALLWAGHTTRMLEVRTP